MLLSLNLGLQICLYCTLNTELRLKCTALVIKHRLSGVLHAVEQAKEYVYSNWPAHDSQILSPQQLFQSINLFPCTFQLLWLKFKLPIEDLIWALLLIIESLYFLLHLSDLLVSLLSQHRGLVEFVLPDGQLLLVPIRLRLRLRQISFSLLKALLSLFQLSLQSVDSHLQLCDFGHLNFKVFLEHRVLLCEVISVFRHGAQISF